MQGGKSHGKYVRYASTKISEVSSFSTRLIAQENAEDFLYTLSTLKEAAELQECKCMC